MKNSSLLRYSLLVGGLYFLCMSIAHYFSIRVPVLFVYYDIPYYAYQNMIISFALLAYVGLFYLSAKSKENVPVILAVLGLTVLGLCSVNISTEFELMTLLKPKEPYWIQTGLLGVYWLYLVILYIKDTSKD